MWLQTLVLKDPNEYQALSKNEEIIWLAHILLLFFQIYINMLWLQKHRKESKCYIVFSTIFPEDIFSITSRKFNCNYMGIPEKAMAPHSSTLAWTIPWMEDPGRLQSMGSLRVGHDWATSLSLLTLMHWRRKWQPTPVFLPGESQGWRSLVGCRLWGHTESDTTEVT